MAKNTSGYPNRELLQLAHVYKGNPISGWYVSEKLDGVRCFWDGGLTRGLRVEDVPFANIEKQHIKVDQHYATGLWSRYGHPWPAPDWFLDSLPKIPLDGELYLGRKRFEETVSIVRAHNSGEKWRNITYKVFETVSLYEVFREGMINNPNFVKLYDASILPWVLDKAQRAGVKVLEKRQFITQLKLMELFIPENDCIVRHVQTKLSTKESTAKVQINTMLSDIIAADGEGLIVRDPMAYWVPKRCDHILKLKDSLDSEGKVIGYVSGLGKYLGMVGALTVEWEGKVFNLSGLNDSERSLDNETSAWCIKNPDCKLPEELNSSIFPRGCTVTFGYASLTNQGYPKEAKYLRKWSK